MDTVQQLLKKYEGFISAINWTIKEHDCGVETFMGLQTKLSFYTDFVSELKKIEAEYQSQSKESLQVPDGVQEPCLKCGKTIRQQSQGCGFIDCYRQYLHTPTPNEQDGWGEDATDIAEGLRNSYYKETGNYWRNGVNGYSQWLEDKIIEYRTQTL